MGWDTGRMIDLDACTPVTLHRNSFPVEGIGEVTVSTVRLPALFGYGRPRFETAVLWTPLFDGDEGCHIVDVSYNQAVAVSTHLGLCDGAVLARLISDRRVNGIVDPWL